MGRTRRARRNEDRLTAALVVAITVLAALYLWYAPSATVLSTFAPSGAMAAVMGVFLAVAMRRRV